MDLTELKTLHAHAYVLFWSVIRFVLLLPCLQGYFGAVGALLELLKMTDEQ